MPKFLTVVYTIHDEEIFKKENERVFENFKESKGEPWAITAISRDHEMNRLHLIQEAMDAGSMETIEEICSHVDIGNIDSLDQLDT